MLFGVRCTSPDLNPGVLSWVAENDDDMVKIYKFHCILCLKISLFVNHMNMEGQMRSIGCRVLGFKEEMFMTS